MNSKEKALDLYSKYGDTLHVHILAKECSLIAVDEIIQTNADTSKYGTEFTKYWKQVKKEIENL